MTELKELFEMVTNKIEPNLDAWREQEQQQRRRSTRTRITAFAVAAAILTATIVAAVTLRNTGSDVPLASTTPEPSAPSDASSLIAFDVLSGQANPVIADVGSFRPASSPDGERIAFLRSVKGHPEIFVADVDGSHATQVTGLPGQRGCGCGSFDPAWSPDGTRIAFSGTSEVGNRGIYVLTLSTGGVRLLTHEGGSSFETAPSWSPDGARIAYAQGSWQAEPAGSGMIFATPASGRRPPFLLLADRRGATTPSWSPDGRRIVYVADVRGGTSLFVTTADGQDASRAQRIGGGIADAAPAWSPDGAQVAFARGNQIAILTVGTGEVRTLGVGGDPAWSPDGQTVYAWRA